MAYGLLAGVSPSSGLYMAFFPTLVYFVFGTSRHISVGTLSVISLMTLKVVQTYATTNEMGAGNSNSTAIPSDPTHEHFTPLQVVTACAFMCGIHQVIWEEKNDLRLVTEATSSHFEVSRCEGIAIRFNWLVIFIFWIIHFQLLMSFFRLGSLAALLSEPLVNGFTTGAAVHVTVSQLKDLFGVKIPRHKGAFKIINVNNCKKSFFLSNIE